ncbi:hypothetical protein [Romboutsia sp. 1001713B170131_170501_G6]|uniref:hypothetical protein n=1 Tax=Romboutsia sp. 1001713B170131_170501_G6 TaxID=2787108 RepID=UPI0018AB1C33|nr:hypothetical protein [Romboutsia sp. 1001713B170131_170501_G6]
MKKYIIILCCIIFGSVLIIGCSKNEQDAKNNYPIIKTSTANKTEIGELLFEKYLKDSYENYVNDEGKTINILNDYNIVSSELTDTQGNDTFLVGIHYEVQSIDGYSTVFITGNGVEYEDNWIKEKYQIVEVKKIAKDKYTIVGVYTG